MTQQPDPSLVGRLAARVLDAEIKEIRDLGAMDVSEHLETEIAEHCDTGEDAVELIAAVRRFIQTAPITYPRTIAPASVGELSPTEAGELGHWLRALPHGTLLDAAPGSTHPLWRVSAAHVFEHGPRPALVEVLSLATLDIGADSRDLAGIAASRAPFTVRELGTPVKLGDRSPTDPDGLGAWLRALPGASVLDRDGHPAQIVTGVETREGVVIRTFPARASSHRFGHRELSAGCRDLRTLAETEAPYTLVAFAAPSSKEWKQAAR